MGRVCSCIDVRAAHSSCIYSSTMLMMRTECSKKMELSTQPAEGQWKYKALTKQ